MAEIIAFPLPVGPNFSIPDVGDLNWGQAVTNFLVAIPNGVPPTAGTFTLTGDLSFGASFGLVTKYFKSVSPNIASVGSFRLAHADAIAFRNFANTGDLLLAVDNSNNITFNGATFGISGAVNPGLANQLGYYATSSDAISPLPSITANRALQSNASGLPVASTVTSTTLAFLDATSSVQTQINAVVSTANSASTVANAALPRAGGTMTGEIAMSANKITGLANGTNPQDAAAFGQIPTAVVPTGSITMYGGSSAPGGWLLCDGSAVSRTTYSALFAIISTTFGVGDGSTTFNLPNATNRAPVGPGSIAALGAVAGNQTHAITVAEIPANIPVSISDPGHIHTEKILATGGAQTGPFPGTGTGNVSSNTTTVAATTGITATASGSGTAMSLVQPSFGVNFIIKT